MKAAQLIKYGGQEAIEIREVTKPSPAADEVLVQVHAAAVNPFDVKVRDGLVRDMAEVRFPATLGGDVAGTVAAVGDSVTGFKIGQAVYGQANALGGQGSFAEYTPVKAGQLAPQPANLDFIEAASLPLISCSAYQALVDHMNLGPNQKILIHGGSGGIGSIAIQLAKHLGASVTTTVSASDSALVKNLGADETIDYKTQDFSKTIKNYDAVFDTVGGGANRKSYGVLKSGGALVSMVDQPDEELVQKHHIKYIAQFTQVTTERLTKVSKLVEKNILNPSIDKIFPLHQTAEALEYLKITHGHGKVLIII